MQTQNGIGREGGRCDSLVHPDLGFIYNQENLAFSKARHIKGTIDIRRIINLLLQRSKQLES